MKTAYACDNCGREFGSRAALAAHTQKCTGPDRVETRQADRDHRPEEISREKAEGRVPFHVQKRRAGFAADDGDFVRRIFNDGWAFDKKRIERALKGGWEVDDEYENTGDHVGANENGNSISGVCMKIRKDWYEEDQESKRKPRRQRAHDIRHGQHKDKTLENSFNPNDLPGANGGLQIDSNFM